MSDAQFSSLPAHLALGALQLTAHISLTFFHKIKLYIYKR